MTTALLEIQDGGPIFPGSETGKKLGLLLEDFSGDTYLWKTGERITVSFVAARNPGNGAFSRLLDSLFGFGFTVCVPTPFAHMKQILTAKGFRETWEDDRDFGPVELWVRGPITQHKETLDA